MSLRSWLFSTSPMGVMVSIRIVNASFGTDSGSLLSVQRTAFFPRTNCNSPAGTSIVRSNTTSSAKKARISRSIIS